MSRISWVSVRAALPWVIGLAGFSGLLGGGITPPAAAAPGAAARVTEAAGGFSYVPPLGWKVRPFPGLKYKIAYATPSDGFAPNLNFVDEEAGVPLDRYAALSLVQMTRAFPEFKKQSQSSFVTAAGLKGVKMVSLNTTAGRRLRQVYYLFPGRGSTKFVITASSLASDGAKYDRTVDASVKTFTAK